MPTSINKRRITISNQNKMNRTTGHPQILITGVENRPDIAEDVLEYVSRKVGEVKCLKLIQPVSKERDCHVYIRFWQDRAVERALEYLERAANASPGTRWKVERSRATNGNL